MKMLKQYLLAIALFFFSGSILHAVPVVQWDTVSGNFGISNFGVETMMTGFNIAAFFGTMLFDDTKLWAELTANKGFIGTPHQWFPMNYGDPVDAAATAAATDPFVVVYGDRRIFETIHLDLNESYYLGFQLGSTEFYPNVVQYGWAELLYDGSSISVRSSATERTGLGIYTGTGMVIPEPATMELLILGAAGIIWKRSRTIGCRLSAPKRASSLNRDVLQSDVNI